MLPPPFKVVVVDVLSGYGDCASYSAVVAEHKFNKSGLTAAGGADDSSDFARRHVKCHPFERVRQGVWIIFEINRVDANALFSFEVFYAAAFRFLIFTAVYLVDSFE